MPAASRLPIKARIPFRRFIGEPAELQQSERVVLEPELRPHFVGSQCAHHAVGRQILLLIVSIILNKVLTGTTIAITICYGPVDRSRRGARVVERLLAEREVQQR
jgi:hypothetical protein